MSFDAFSQYPPVDGDLVDRIVCKLKSQGIFDQFRKDCLADVDTKPAYQNLQQRVNGTVATFLATQTWQQDLNKTQLRESLRRHVQQGFLEVGVDRIVDQVVNPKVFTVFMPKVEDVVYDCLGIEKPKHPPSSNNLMSGRKLTLLDLLPKDLDPVSPDSDNLSFNDDDTKDETNNNESSSKLDISHDSQVSGISDLSSHMGDSFKENHIDSNTAKSIASAKENSTEPHFENFENLSEKIKQAEIGGHNSTTSPLLEEQDNSESKVTLQVDQELQKDNIDETLMEIDSVSNSTFEDAKTFTNKIIKEDTCSRTLSEDSLSCSSFNSKFKKEKSKSVIVENSGNGMDKSEVDNPCKEHSSDEVKKISVNDDVDIKKEEKVMENKEAKKTDEPKDKKLHDSSSSKTSKSNRPSDSKHRSSSDKKDDIKQNKEKAYKEEKDKDKSNKDDKERSSRHKDDRHHSSKDKYKDKDRNDRSKEKDSDKKKDKSDYKDLSEKDKKNDKDKHKDRDKNDKDKTRSDKENHKYEKDKSRSEKDKDRHEKEKDKDKHEKTRRDKDKEKREKDKNDSKEKDKDSNHKDKDKNEKDKSRERDRGKSEKDYKNEKDKENRTADDKVKDEKKRDSKKHDRSSSTSSMKKDDNYKDKKNEENTKYKALNSKSAKNEDEKRDRKRKSERCNDEIKLKEARRSWDRDSSGGNGKGHGSHKSNNSEYKVSSSSSSTKEKRTGESSSNQQKGNERKLEPDGDAEEPSDVDKILMKINSSIEESQNIQSNDEQAIKKPKIARNIFEIKKIMLARKNIARQAFKQDKKRKEMMDSVEEVDSTDSPSTTKPATRDNPKTREENKENIKTEQMDKLKNHKVGLVKGKFTGFLESDIEQSRNSLQIFRAHFSNFCTSMGMELLPTENIEKIDFSKICDLSDDLLDDNLNKLKPKPVSLERRKTLPDEKQVSKAVENIMNGKNGCYVLLKDCCTEVVEAMRNVTQPPLNKSAKKPMSSKPQPSSAIEEDSGKSNSGENVKMLDQSPKKETLSSPVKPVSQPSAIVATDVTEILCHTSQQQLKEQGNWAKKSAVRTSPTRQQPTENKEEEPFSPVADVTIALNTYLNDSKEILPSVPLTEAMLDNLMQQSSIILEDETFADSDDSMPESESVIKPLVSADSNFEREESSIRTSGDIYYSSDVDHSDDLMPKSKNNSNVIDNSTCDIFSHNKDSNEETSEMKVIKRRNQRVCRSASQRYDSTDLYKPRPVLPQNSKRVRTPRSVSSEDVSTREQYECTPSRKRAR